MNDKMHSPSSQPVEKEIDPLEFLRTFQQGKWTIFFYVFISTIIAFVLAYGLSPIYKANTLLRVENQRANIPGLEELAALNNVDTSVGTELVLIKSRKNLAIAVDTLNLDLIAYPKKIYLFSNLFKRFFSPTETEKLPQIWEKFDSLVHKYAWGNEQIKVDQLIIAKKWLNKPFTLVAKKNEAFDILSNNSVLLSGKVGQTSKSSDNLFSIFVSELTGLPGTEFHIMKLSMRRAITNLQDKINASEKGKSTGIINLSLTGKNQERIVKTLNKISETYVEQNKSRSSEEASNALKFLEEQIKPVKEDVDKAEANLKNYRTENKTTNLPQETQAVLDVISKIDTDLQQYSLKREELRRLYTDQHPTIQAIISQQNKLKELKEKTQSKISKLPKSQQKLFKLERDIKVSNSIYVDLLNNIQEFKIAKASTVGNAYVVDVADIDEHFVSPNKKMIFAIGALIGVILGYIIVIYRIGLRRTVDNPDIIEEETGIPVYATIPLSKKVKLTGVIRTKNRKQKSLLAADYKTDPAIEGLRSLRTSLHFALNEAKNNIVMFTGPSPNVGKSFVSSNFAAVAAATGQRVILIDADMRKGYLHQLFNMKLVPGLSDIISMKTTLDKMIHTVQVGDNESIDFISHGQTPPNPSELLMNEYFRKLLAYLSREYDLVIIDTPPVQAVTDPAIIGSHSGVVFMVVRSEHHSMKEIKHAINHLSMTNVATKGLIFNGFNPKKGQYEYGYGYYSYDGKLK